MKFVHKVKHAKKYVYHKFCLEVPELAALYEKDGEDWVKQANECRQSEIADLKSPTESWSGEKKTKTQIKKDLKELEERLKTDLKPATLEEWKNSRDVITYIQLELNKLTGSFEIQVCREMTCFDKMKGANNRKNSGVRRWEDVVVAEKVIPDDLPLKPMTKAEDAEATEVINDRRDYNVINRKQ